MIEGALSALILSKSAVTELVDQRVYPVRADQKAALPYVTFQRISGVPARGIAGPTSRATSRFQVNCWGRTIVEAKRLAKAVQQIDGYRGWIGGHRLGGVSLDDQQDNNEPPSDGGARVVPGVQMDWIILHDEE